MPKLTLDGKKIGESFHTETIYKYSNKISFELHKQSQKNSVSKKEDFIIEIIALQSDFVLQICRDFHKLEQSVNQLILAELPLEMVLLLLKTASLPHVLYTQACSAATTPAFVRDLTMTQIDYLQTICEDLMRDMPRKDARSALATIPLNAITTCLSNHFHIKQVDLSGLVLDSEEYAVVSQYERLLNQYTQFILPKDMRAEIEKKEEPSPLVALHFLNTNHSGFSHHDAAQPPMQGLQFNK